MMKNEKRKMTKFLDIFYLSFVISSHALRGLKANEILKLNINLL
jgi:hypothetical protein